MRYYYIKDGVPAYNIKEPLENILPDTTGYQQVTKEQWDALQPAPHVPTQDEIETQQKLARIAELKSLLAQTDYLAIKYAEGWITEQEYAPTKALRQAYRDEINQLEAELQ